MPILARAKVSGKVKQARPRPSSGAAPRNCICILLIAASGPPCSKSGSKARPSLGRAGGLNWIKTRGEKGRGTLKVTTNYTVSKNTHVCSLAEGGNVGIRKRTYVYVQGREKGLQILLSYSQAEKLSMARKKYIATTYQPFCSALYVHWARKKRTRSGLNWITASYGSYGKGGVLVWRHFRF